MKKNLLCIIPPISPPVSIPAYSPTLIPISPPIFVLCNVGGDLDELVLILTEQMQMSEEQQEQWTNDGNGSYILIVRTFLLFVHFIVRTMVFIVRTFCVDCFLPLILMRG